MAKKSSQSSGVNKTQAIKDALAANPDKLPKELSALLKEQGVDASAAYVSTVKSALKKKKGGRRGPKPAAASSGDGLSLATLVAAKKLAAQLGGVAEAKRAIDALSKLVD